MRVNEGAGPRIGATRAATEPAPTAAAADGQRLQAGTLSEVAIAAPDAAAAGGGRAEAELTQVAPTTIEELDDFSGDTGAGTRYALSASIGAEASQQAGPVKASMAQVAAPTIGRRPNCRPAPARCPCRVPHRQPRP